MLNVQQKTYVFENQNVLIRRAVAKIQKQKDVVARNISATLENANGSKITIANPV